MGKRVGWLLAAGVCVLCGAALCFAQLDNVAKLNARAMAAYKNRDYAAYLAFEKQALGFTPGDTRVIYNVACGEALAGHAAESLQQLDKLLALKLDLGADQDPDFTNILQTPEWAKFKEGLAELRKPLVRSTTAFTIPEKTLLATNLAVDEQTGDTYIGSSRERKVVKRTRDGAFSDFATEKDGLFGVWFLLVDQIHKQLLVSTSALPSMQGFKPEDANKVGICIFDLATGKLVRKAFLPGGADRHFFTEMAEDKSGNVFVTDSGSSEIYRLRRASSELELFISSVVFREPGGLAFSDDERTLYVADYVEGMWALEVLSNDRRHMDAPANAWLGGLNGIARVPDGLIAVQTGARPNRVVRIHLDPKDDHIISVETLESNHPAYSEPIQGTVSGSDFLYVANSQLDLANLTTGAFAEDKAKPTTVLRLPLGK